MYATGYVNTAVTIKDVSHKFCFDTDLIAFIFLSLHIFCVCWLRPLDWVIQVILAHLARSHWGWEMKRENIYFCYKIF